MTTFSHSYQGCPYLFTIFEFAESKHVVSSAPNPTEEQQKVENTFTKCLNELLFPPPIAGAVTLQLHNHWKASLPTGKGKHMELLRASQLHVGSVHVNNEKSRFLYQHDYRDSLLEDFTQFKAQNTSTV